MSLAAAVLDEVKCPRISRRDRWRAGFNSLRDIASHFCDDAAAPRATRRVVDRRASAPIGGGTATTH
jgi:hypothetical protein